MSPCILVVCTANQCRSPVGQALLSTMPDGRSWPDPGWRVASAGVAARDGAPAVNDSVRIASDWGVDLSTHRARRLDRDLVDAADLVVTMETGHLADVLRLVPSALPRSFAWLELARLATSMRVDDATWDDEDVADATSRLHVATRALHHARPLTPGAEGPEDVADPIGRPSTAFDAMADTLVRAAEQFAPLLVGAEGPSPD
ncbi:hypothetical protein [Salsipaludibacter albus]|uniref:arsenate reductase/protein-tyrosine-phosphatase family protein n=1 Tax=Salsipaludibacter albus TaxID=2849650 RepID=UPI001EE43404|nr:hypothetical protein [Salsipaludibacter albus]MBY5163606.1 hypothetical protein [Salsipaludibacter albus]